jgi:carbonic anhydrase
MDGVTETRVACDQFLEGCVIKQFQAELLRTSSTVIPDAVKTGTLKVEAGVYDLASGKVTLS